jgi:hypothetical protein
MAKIIFYKFKFIKNYINNYLLKIIKNAYFFFDNVYISNFVYNTLKLDVYYSSYAYRNIKYVDKNTKCYLVI